LTSGAIDWNDLIGKLHVKRRQSAAIKDDQQKHIYDWQANGLSQVV